MSCSLRIRAGIIVLCAGLLCSGCVSMHPVLTGEPTPAPSPTPTPAPLLQSLPLPTPVLDAAGNPVEAEEGHYDAYVSYRQMRVYEYELGTLLDGICVNAYPEPLCGAVELLFADAGGALLASAMLYTAGAEEELLLQPGENRIYAQIDTDMDIQSVDFSLAVRSHFAPLAQPARDDARPETAG